MKRIREDEIVIRDGLIYHQSSTEPFTGIVEWFHENGQLLSKGNSKDGKLEGLTEYFDRWGNLTGTTTWENGERVASNDFDRKGNLTRTEMWENGELVELWENGEMVDITIHTIHVDDLE
jgi:antitoxin component YwqK of YwqJK toxin-antitoxin module